MFFVLALPGRRLRYGGFIWRHEWRGLAFGLHRFGNCQGALVIPLWPRLGAS